MSEKGEEELEFIESGVKYEDEDMTSSYGVAGVGSGGGGSGVGGRGGNPADAVIGNWLLNQSKHPLSILFHILFKSAALFIYMFGGWFTDNFIFTFVICIILLAFDFWTVKNVSGRLLVGLRWWSYVREDGSNEWIFESLEDMAEISAFDSRVFWGALYLTPIAWSLMLIIGVLRLKFQFLPIVIAALIMSGANIVGYMKCSNSAKNKIKNMMDAGLRTGSSAALENSTFRNWIFSSLLAVAANPTSSGTSGASKRQDDGL